MFKVSQLRCNLNESTQKSTRQTNKLLKYVNKSLMGNDRLLISKEQKLRKILPDGL